MIQIYLKKKNNNKTGMRLHMGITLWKSKTPKSVFYDYNKATAKASLMWQNSELEALNPRGTLTTCIRKPFCFPLCCWFYENYEIKYKI